MLFRSTTARTGWRRGLSSAYRKLGYALVFGIFGYLGAADPAFATPAGQPLLVDFYFDLSDDGMGEPGLEPAEATGGPGDLEVAGIPIRLGEHDGMADDGWRTIGGARGQHILPLTDRLTVVSTVRAARTDFVAESAPGKAVASAASDLRYARGGWTVAVGPAVELTRWETHALAQDSSIEGQVSKALGGGLSLASTGRYNWRQSTVDQSHAEIAFGRLGLVCQLPEQVRLEMGYVVRQEEAAALTLGTGPSVGMSLPLVENVDLSASYDLTQTVRDGAAARQDSEAWNKHHLGLGMTWDVAGVSDLKVATAYRYEHGGADPAQRDAANHAGTVSFALDF